MALTKTSVSPDPKIITAVAAGGQSISDAIDVSGKYSIVLTISHAHDSASANAGSGCEYQVEVSQLASGDSDWAKFIVVNAPIITPVSIVTDGTEASGSTVIECGSVVPTVGNYVFFKNATIANSEWAKVVSVVTTSGSESFTLQDGLTNSQAAGTYYNGGIKFVIPIDLVGTPVKRLRVVCNNNVAGATNRDIVWACKAATTDAIS